MINVYINKQALVDWIAYDFQRIECKGVYSL